MASPRGRRKSADERAVEAARHAAIRKQAIEATASLGTMSSDGGIDIEKLADMLGAEIVYGDLGGPKARVVQIGNRARIIISKRIVGVGAIRFCIAHEIGHLLLKHYAQGDELGRAFKRQRTCEPMNGDGSEIERDACVFATECLMPAPLAGPMCQVAPVFFDPVRTISSAFVTSLQASAMRFVELTNERCAVVYMQLGRVLWAKKERGPQRVDPERSRRGARLGGVGLFRRRSARRKPRASCSDVVSTRDARQGLGCVRAHDRDPRAGRCIFVALAAPHITVETYLAERAPDLRV